jgi:hypothetical protein
MVKYKVELDYEDWIKLITIVSNYSGMTNGIHLSKDIKLGFLEEFNNKLYISFDEVRQKAILKEKFE